MKVGTCRAEARPTGRMQVGLQADNGRQCCRSAFRPTTGGEGISEQPEQRPRKVVQGEKLRGADKIARIPVKVDADRRAAAQARLDPRARAALARGRRASSEILREHKLASVCEEAQCPNLRRVLQRRHRDLHDHGRHLHAPLPVLRRGARPPERRSMPTSRAQLAEAIAEMGLRYVVDHLGGPRRPARRRGRAFRRLHPRRRASSIPGIRVEVLVPDFRGRMDIALDILERDAAGRVQPQPRDRAAPVPAGAARAPITSGRWTCSQRYKAALPRRARPSPA